jgi:flagellar motility protein MotE (MotC chaperone)
MKAKILLGLVFINFICIGIYLVFQETPVVAGNTANNAQSSTKAEQVQPSPQNIPQPIGLSPADQIEILRQKEEKIKARETELKELEKQVQEKLNRLEAIESSIKVDLASYKSVSGERIKHLVKIYSSMKPNAAATLMNNIDTDVAVQVFLGMKGDIAGRILSYMEPVKAAGITQKLVYYRGGSTASAETTAAEK